MIYITNPWQQILPGTAVFTVIGWYFLKNRFADSWRDIRARGLRASWLSCLWRLRWHFLCAIAAFFFWTAGVAGLQKCFYGFEDTGANLVLRYPWPRSDVVLKWSEIDDVRVEQGQVRTRYKFRVVVEANRSVYMTLWLGTRSEAEANCKIIGSRVSQAKK